jgi:hypothetical protein
MHHRLSPRPEEFLQLTAFNQRIHDTGFDRFIRKFDPEIEMEASVAIVKGFHEDHGLAIYFTQKKRR